MLIGMFASLTLSTAASATAFDVTCKLEGLKEDVDDGTSEFRPFKFVMQDDWKNAAMLSSEKQDFSMPMTCDGSKANLTCETVSQDPPLKLQCEYAEQQSFSCTMSFVIPWFGSEVALPYICK